MADGQPATVGQLIDRLAEQHVRQELLDENGNPDYIYVVSVGAWQ